jgi:hypothetical protein
MQEAIAATKRKILPGNGTAVDCTREIYPYIDDELPICNPADQSPMKELYSPGRVGERRLVCQGMHIGNDDQMDSALENLINNLLYSMHLHCCKPRDLQSIIFEYEADGLLTTKCSWIYTL